MTFPITLRTYKSRVIDDAGTKTQFAGAALGLIWFLSRPIGDAAKHAVNPSLFNRGGGYAALFIFGLGSAIRFGAQMMEAADQDNELRNGPSS